MALTTSEAAEKVAKLAQFPDQTVPGENAPDTKAALIAIIQGAGGLDPNSFQPGDPSERFLEYSARAIKSYSKVGIQSVVNHFFRLSTDPGDVDDYGTPDGSADQTPRPGFLSAMGSERFYTTRGEETHATAFVTVKNNTAQATAPFGPGRLTFEQSGADRDDGGKPTYITTADPDIYTGIGGTTTIAAGATKVLPVQCVQLGSYGSSPLNGIDTCNTETYGVLTVLSSTTAIGSDREARNDYIARCLTWANSNAPGGSQKAYIRAATTGRDGKKLQRYDGSGEVTITGASVTIESGDCEVTVYYYGPAGAVDQVDVSSANANASGIVLGVITDPLGVLPDAVVMGPDTADPNTGAPGGESCVNEPIAIHWTAKAKSKDISGNPPAGTYATPWEPDTDYVVGQAVQNGTRLYICDTDGTSASSGGPTGVSANIVDGTARWDYSAPLSANTSGTLALFSAVAAGEGVYLLSTGVGGDDAVAGAGVVYTNSIQDHLSDGFPKLYKPAVSIPGGTSTAIAAGRIAVAGTVTGVLVVT